MAETTLETRVTRLEAKGENLDIYLPKLLDSIERSNTEIKEMVRFTRFERLALIAAVAAIPAAIYFS